MECSANGKGAAGRAGVSAAAQLSPRASELTVLTEAGLARTAFAYRPAIGQWAKVMNTTPTS